MVLSCSEGQDMKTESGIIVPIDNREADDSTQEVVLAVGPDVKTVEVGQKVLFKRHLFQVYEIEKKNHLIGKGEGIIAVL